MPIDIINDLTKNAMGGTELMAYELQKRLDPDLLDKFQIIPSRLSQPLDPDRKRILWLHDLPGDPASAHLANGGYNSFDKIVFVSNWQMQAYISHYGIPWYKCAVLKNAINPLGMAHGSQEGSPTRLIYHTTPHRGLALLYIAFEQLSKELDIELDVYSSFKVYGWEERDKPFQELFDALEAHPRIRYHGSVPNSEVRTALMKANIFAYPSIWPETSCIALMEAMSAGLYCVHPNYAALSETAANWTNMYQFRENHRDHVAEFSSSLRATIDRHQKSIGGDSDLIAQKAYADRFYSWSRRQVEWEILLRSLL